MSQAHPSTAGSPPGDRSLRRRLLLALVGLESLAMAVVTVGYAVALLVDRRQTGAGYVVFEIVLAAVATGALGLVGRGLVRSRRWAYSLGATLQLVGLPFGFRLFQFGYWWAAVPELAVVLTTLVLLFAESPPPSGETAEPDSE